MGNESGEVAEPGHHARPWRYRSRVQRPVEDPPTFPTRHAPWLRAVLAPSGTFARAQQFVVVALVQVLAAVALSALSHEVSAPSALGFTLLVVGPAFLLVGEPAVLRAVGTVLAAAAYLAAGNPAGPGLLAPVLGLLGAVMVGRLLPVVAVGLGGTLVFVLGSWIGPEPVTLAALPGHLAWVTVVLAFAAALRLHGEREEARARVVDEFARRRAAEERLRIARNLHESLTHEISLMSTRARMARHILSTAGWRRAEEIGAALEEISAGGVDVMAEVRAVSGVLEAEGASGASRPVPGLSGLPYLVTECEQVGMRVTVSGSPGRLYRAVDQAAYLVVEASLHELARASAAVSATVDLDLVEAAGTSRLVVVVGEEPARGRRPEAAPREDEPGDELAVVADRVRALGGTVHVGHAEDGAWRVRAWLPLRLDGVTAGRRACADDRGRVTPEVSPGSS